MKAPNARGAAGSALPALGSVGLGGGVRGAMDLSGMDGFDCDRDNDILHEDPDQDVGFDGGDDEELAILQQLLQKTAAKKRESVAKRQAAIVEDLKQEALKRAAAVDDAIKRDVQGLVTQAKGQYTRAQKKLQSRMEEIEAITNKYQQDLQAAWQSYSEDYESVMQVTHQLSAAVEGKQTGIKRKMQQLQQENEAALEEGRRKVAEVRKKSAATTPALSKLLHNFMTNAS
ncbi:hypothetical protein HYH03_006790 [Edaphochlamys debaryana]|uniref:Uncharacterized protein n=1 Tax=Edaphochlamys debaryana TaxID=47281 RepID=A0A835YCV6_9CHLO|nr:hypothetical protein HYH03_006790 [Edaphochlamys debaryana]|eukprot:KAG2495184.1 hypothetical protein HYH03_006790 [Edaphochlamys debaryana]